MRSCSIIGSLLLVIAAGLPSGAQNLVPNCDFDLYTQCPDEHSQLNRAVAWFTPGEGTTDFCHECSGNQVTIPQNLWGSQLPLSGGGYAHIISYYPYQGSDYREYLEVELACPLPPGEEFEVSFYVSCSDKSRYAIDGMGLFFSDSRLVQSGYQVVDLGGSAHISNPAGNILMDQSGWTKISGIFTSAGGERFITIGNFSRDNDLQIHNFTGQSRYSSYYIDMVSVVPLNEWLDLGNDTTVCPEEVFTLDASLLCSGKYRWNTGSTDPSIEITEPGYYTVEIELGCGVISDGITVAHFPSPDKTLPDDTIFCEGSTITLDAGDFVSYQWNTGHYSRYIEVSDEGNYTVEAVDSFGCPCHDTVTVFKLAEPVSWLPGDTTLCLDDSLLVVAGMEDKYHQYTWSDGYAAAERNIKDKGIYWVDIVNPCGSISDTFRLGKFNCETSLWIPNAFTPDNDGKNDRFRAHGQNIADFILMVFNRWGEKVYESKNIDEGWDGTSGGQASPGGAYVFVVTYRPSAVENAGMEAKKGTFLLIR